MECAERDDDRGSGTLYLPSLRFMRQRAGLTPPELAERANLSAGTIYGLERGAWQARISTAQRLAEALRVEVDDLARDEERRSA